MKKLLGLILMLVLIAADAYAGGSRPPSNSNTYQGCLAQVQFDCAKFGSAWAPRWPKEKCNFVTDSAGSHLACIPNDPKPASFIEYDEEGSLLCTTPKYATCNKKFLNNF